MAAESKELSLNIAERCDAQTYPYLLTEEELITFLRIPEISTSQNYHNVIENLKRIHGLPRLHLCGKVLYPLEATKEWVRQNTVFEK